MQDAITFPNLGDMVQNTYTQRDFLNYYKNIWTRNLAVRLIDIETDTKTKAIDPEKKVMAEDGFETTVKNRLENRKIYAQDALDILASINGLLALDDAALDAKSSPEALAVAEDMKPASTESPFKSYNVLVDGVVPTPEGNPVAFESKGAVVTLDSTAQATIDFLSNGSISEITA